MDGSVDDSYLHAASTLNFEVDQEDLEANMKISFSSSIRQSWVRTKIAFGKVD